MAPMNCFASLFVDHQAAFSEHPNFSRAQNRQLIGMLNLDEIVLEVEPDTNSEQRS